MEVVVIPWIVALVLVIWWAGVWGRSRLWAFIGALILSPVIWAVVLLILGRKSEHPEA